jgi:hypothetical protein
MLFSAASKDVSEHESVWLNFENSEGERFRIGVDPSGRHVINVRFRNEKNETVIADNIR